MRYGFILLLLASVGFAEVNSKYSFGDFTGQSFKGEPAKDFNNTEIVGSCFYQEWVTGDVVKDIFPDGMTGVTFRRCNLDNVLIPVGNTVVTDGWEACSQRKISVQNDLEDWVLDNSLKPIEPVRKEQFEQYGVSTDPKDIPNTKFTEEERKQFEENFNTLDLAP